MSLKRIFQGFWQVQNTYFVEHISMVAYDNILWEKQYIIFQQILSSLEKPAYAPRLFIPFLKYWKIFWKFFSNNLLQTLCYLIVRRVIKMEGFTVNIYIEAVLINGAK